MFDLASEFGNLSYPVLHDWLHVRLKKLVDDGLVKFAVSGGFELLLVNISILVTNGRGSKLHAHWEAFENWYHLRS